MPRRRYRFDEKLGEMVEIGAEWQPTPFSSSHKSQAEIYGDARATDGADISSPTKRKRYAREVYEKTGRELTHPSDFTQHWAKEGERREAWAKGDFGNWDDRARKQAIGETIYRLKEKNRR